LAGEGKGQLKCELNKHEQTPDTNNCFINSRKWHALLALC